MKRQVKVERIITSQVYYAEPIFTLEEYLQIMSKVHVTCKPIAILSMRHSMEDVYSAQNNQEAI